MQNRFMPGEVMYEDVVTLSQKGTAHDKSVGMGHGKGRWLVVPALTPEGKPEPVYDGLMIKFLSGVDNGSWESNPRFGRREIALE